MSSFRAMLQQAKTVGGNLLVRIWLHSFIASIRGQVRSAMNYVLASYTLTFSLPGIVVGICNFLSYFGSYLYVFGNGFISTWGYSFAGYPTLAAIVSFFSTAFAPGSLLWLGPVLFWVPSLWVSYLSFCFIRALWSARRWRNNLTKTENLASLAAALISKAGVVALTFVVIKSFMILWTKIVELRKSLYEDTREPTYEGKPTPDGIYKHLLQAEIWLSWFNQTAEMVKKLDTFKGVGDDSRVVSNVIRGFSRFLPKDKKEAVGDYLLGCCNCDQPYELCACRYYSPCVLLEGENQNFVPVSVEHTQIGSKIYQKGKFLFLRSRGITWEKEDDIVLPNQEGTYTRECLCPKCSQWQFMYKYDIDWNTNRPKDDQYFTNQKLAFQTMAKKGLLCDSCSLDESRPDVKIMDDVEFSPSSILEKAKKFCGEIAEYADFELTPVNVAYAAVMTSIGVVSIGLIFKPECFKRLLNSLSRGGQSVADTAVDIYSKISGGMENAKDSLVEFLDPRPKPLLLQIAPEVPKLEQNECIVGDAQKKVSIFKETVLKALSELKDKVEVQGNELKRYVDEKTSYGKMLKAANVPLIEPEKPKKVTIYGFDESGKSIIVDIEPVKIISGTTWLFRRKVFEGGKRGKGMTGGGDQKNIEDSKKKYVRRDAGGKIVNKPTLGAVQPGYSQPKNLSSTDALNAYRRNLVRQNYFASTLHAGMQIDQYLENVATYFQGRVDHHKYYDMFGQDFLVWATLTNHEVPTWVLDEAERQGLFDDRDDSLNQIVEEWDQLDQDAFEEDYKKEQFIPDEKTHITHGWIERYPEAKPQKAIPPPQSPKTDENCGSSGKSVNSFLEGRTKCGASCPGQVLAPSTKIFTCPCNLCFKCNNKIIPKEHRYTTKGGELRIKHYYGCERGCKPAESFVGKAAPFGKVTLNGEDRTFAGKPAGPEAKMSGNPEIDIASLMNRDEKYFIPLYDDLGAVVSYGCLTYTLVEQTSIPVLVHNKHAHDYGAKSYGEERFPLSDFLAYMDSDLAIIPLTPKTTPSGKQFIKFQQIDPKSQRYYMLVPRDNKMFLTHMTGINVDKDQNYIFHHKGSTRPGDCGKIIYNSNMTPVGIHCGTKGENSTNYFIGMTPEVLGWLQKQ